MPEGMSKTSLYVSIFGFLFCIFGSALYLVYSGDREPHECTGITCGCMIIIGIVSTVIMVPVLIIRRKLKREGWKR